MKLDALLAYVNTTGSPFVLSRKRQLGLYYLAQHAQDCGFEVRVDSLSANDLVVERLTRVLKECDCSVLGLYVDHDNMWELRRIVSLIFQAIQGIHVVLGGPQVTGAPGQVLTNIPEAICGVMGEGEETFVELLGLLRRPGFSLENCAGLAYLNVHELRLSPKRSLIRDLDQLSIPRRKELTFEDDGDVSGALVTGRGCAGNCAFCCEGSLASAGDKRVRLRSISQCLEEIDYLVKELGLRYITIVDDSFVIVPERVREFCRGMIDRYGGEVKWYCEARADALDKTEDLLPLMIGAGLIRIQLGGESGSQRILDAYRKGTTVAQLRRVAVRAHECGLLSCYINFIIGGAFETAESFRETRDLACELMELSPGCVSVGYSYFTPYPSTPMYDAPQDYGLVMVDPEVVTGFGDSHVFCRTQTLNRYEILSFGPDFDDHVRSTMQRIAGELPRDTVARIIGAAAQWKVETEWYDVLSRDRALFGYYHSLSMGTSQDFASASAHGIDGCVPVRVVELASSSEARFVVRGSRNRYLHFDPLDSMIVELAAGKLSFREIVEVIAQRISGESLVVIRSELLRRFSALDGENLVVWRIRS